MIDQFGGRSPQSGWTTYICVCLFWYAWMLCSPYYFVQIILFCKWFEIYNALEINGYQNKLSPFYCIIWFLYQCISLSIWNDSGIVLFWNSGTEKGSDILFVILFKLMSWNLLLEFFKRGPKNARIQTEKVVVGC